MPGSKWVPGKKLCLVMLEHSNGNGAKAGGNNEVVTGVNLE